MRIATLFRVLRSRSRAPLSLLHTVASRSFCQLLYRPERPSFGIAFDIDGVIIRGHTPIGGSQQALRRLYGDCGMLKIPFVFLTNGGGVPESKRASELSELLGVNILPLQVVQGHSPFKNLAKSRYENQLVVAVGKGEPATVMFEYGFKNVLSIDEYSSYFDGIDPLSQFKNWEINGEIKKRSTSKEITARHNIFSERVKAVFIVSDSVDWSRDIQGAFPSERLGMGAFRIALESIFNRIHPHALEYTCFGKPNPFVFKNAEAVLRQVQLSSHHDHQAVNNGLAGGHPFRTLYMIGDNPLVDIKGARQAGHPWFSILTRTGVFRGKENHAEFPADLVVDTVEEAMDYILRKEFS
ncbi:PREDICTED: uncharacterized protein YKR070W isoform X4 [Nelumbo nucifera]|uniref:Uncharacterized protein YKR070W isoform X4 n=1 Tax=Nelumbo nucifera TaxID=4432 RepID=A0A1U7ZXX4_NELNU|nr:PREDICTED: uncharacterized protein YKR070W isoform X4 [Nelumbo nucifera]